MGSTSAEDIVAELFQTLETQPLKNLDLNFAEIINSTTTSSIVDKFEASRANHISKKKLKKSKRNSSSGSPEKKKSKKSSEEIAFQKTSNGDPKCLNSPQKHKRKKSSPEEKSQKGQKLPKKCRREPQASTSVVVVNGVDGKSGTTFLETGELSEKFTHKLPDKDSGSSAHSGIKSVRLEDYLKSKGYLAPADAQPSSVMTPISSVITLSAPTTQSAKNAATLSNGSKQKLQLNKPVTTFIPRTVIPRAMLKKSSSIVSSKDGWFKIAKKVEIQLDDISDDSIDESECSAKKSSEETSVNQEKNPQSQAIEDKIDKFSTGNIGTEFDGDEHLKLVDGEYEGRGKKAEVTCQHVDVVNETVCNDNVSSKRRKSTKNEATVKKMDVCNEESNVNEDNAKEAAKTVSQVNDGYTFCILTKQGESTEKMKEKEKAGEKLVSEKSQTKKNKIEKIVFGKIGDKTKSLLAAVPLKKAKKKKQVEEGEIIGSGCDTESSDEDAGGGDEADDGEIKESDDETSKKKKSKKKHKKHRRKAEKQERKIAKEEKKRLKVKSSHSMKSKVRVHSKNLETRVVSKKLVSSVVIAKKELPFSPTEEANSSFEHSDRQREDNRHSDDHDEYYHRYRSAHNDSGAYNERYDQKRRHQEERLEDRSESFPSPRRSMSPSGSSWSRSAQRRNRSSSRDRNFGSSYRKRQSWRGHDYRGGRSRSRSPDRNYDRSVKAMSILSCRDERGDIDKKQLYNIARKNASAMLQQGTLQQIYNMGADEIAKLKAGGTSVDELTDYCRKLQKKQERRANRNTDSSSDESVHDSEEEVVFHHPFALNPARNDKIIFNVKNLTQIPIKTPAERAIDDTRLKLTFPVSSGQQHRTTESEWTPVSPPRPTSSKPPKALESARSVLAIEAAPPVDITFAVPLPPPPPPPPVDTTPPVDIGDVVTSRLKAIRRLYDNPNDLEALKMMHFAEEQMKKWAESKNVPGAFLGGTGASCLTASQLASPHDPKFSAWARKDQLTSCKPLDSGVGMNLLQKMGWKPGEGLGKDKAGSLTPLMLDVKSDRKGLVASEEANAGRNRPCTAICNDMQGRHPVSVLMELCAKRRWNPPSWSCEENGPCHGRRFLWKVTVHGVEYQPATPCNNKKLGKAQTAQVVLQSLGLMPRDASLPVVIG